MAHRHLIYSQGWFQLHSTDPHWSDMRGSNSRYNHGKVVCYLYTNAAYWRGVGDLNSHHLLGRQMCYHYTNSPSGAIHRGYSRHTTQCKAFVFFYVCNRPSSLSGRTNHTYFATCASILRLLAMQFPSLRFRTGGEGGIRTHRILVLSQERVPISSHPHIEKRMAVLLLDTITLEPPF